MSTSRLVLLALSFVKATSAVKVVYLTVKQVWCIGYSRRKPEDFLHALKENRIALLVDVRRFPTSKIEAFKRENLATLLKQANISYLWLGDLLGGYRRGGFEKYMETEDFRRGLKKLVKEALKRRTCLMCVERRQKYCHRRFIAKSLMRLGFEVVEIP